MSSPKAGYKGAIYIGAVKIGGATTWSYSGETRNMQDIDEFEDEIVKQLPLQIVGGDITVSGNYLVDTDAGQKLLKTDFDAATEITDIKLYTDKTNAIYMTPKAGSHVIVTNVNNVGDDKSGVGTFSATLHVNGELEQVGDSDVVQIAAVGIHNLAATAVGFVGELLSMGGETPIECYFEYGTDTTYGTDTYASEDTLTATGMFEFELTPGDLVTATTYHWRAICLYDTDKHAYSADQTFTTP
jgi:hypothetical protein